MPSRELRRAKARKGEAVSDTLEKKKESHPFIYGFSVVVLIVIVVTFIGSPVAGRLGSIGSIVFGSYEGREISYYQGSYFAKEIDRISEQVRRDSSTGQDAAAQGQAIWYQAFISTAQHTALMVTAERAGMRVSEDAVDKALLTYPAYLEEGKFSEEKYQKTSSSEKASARKLYREELISNQFVSDVFQGVKSGTREIDFIKAMAMRERSFSFVSLPFSGFPQDEVRKYAEANKSKFRKIKLSRILVKSGESEAKEIRKKISEKTSSFEELAKAHSKDSFADKGGDMGWRYAYDVEADFEKKETAQEIFSLKAAEVSEVIKGAFGWMIYRCDAAAVDPDFANPSVLDDVKSYLTRYEKGKIEDYFLEKAGLLARRSGEIGFKKAAAEAGLAVQTTDYFPINLQSVFPFAPLRAIPDSATPSTAVYSEDFFHRAFALGKDQVSPPIVLDDQILALELAGERQLPDATASLLGSWIEYIAQQSVQIDLSQGLMTPTKFKDNFAETMARYNIIPSSRQ